MSGLPRKKSTLNSKIVCRLQIADIITVYPSEYTEHTDWRQVKKKKYFSAKRGEFFLL